MIRPRTAFACLTVAASLAAGVVPAAAGAASGPATAKHCGSIPTPGPICHPPVLP